MANFTALKTAINNAIKTNGNEEITGAVLQVILDAMVETLGDSAITNLENALAFEVTNRENAVGSVANDLTAEAEARAALDYQVNNRINQEEYNRQNADAALSQTMSQGFSTLGSQMNALSQAISALNAAYQNGFLYGGVVTPSSSPANGKCFYIALQGGTYTNFGGVGVVQGINILKNDNGWKVEHIYDQTTLLNEFYLLRQQVIQAITSFAPIVIEGDVTNAPDEEDLTSNAQHLLQFKNNAYSPLEFSGLGRKYLRKNIAPLSESAAFNGFVEGVTAEETLSGTPEYIFWDRMNTRFVGIKDGVYYLDWTDSGNYVPASTSLVYMYQGTPYRWDGSDFSVDETEVPNLVNCLTQDMINEANTIYIIRYDYTLKEDITIPANCVLEFDGGSISGEHTITGNNTGIEAGLIKIFNTDVTLAGSWDVVEAYPEWFGAVGNGIADDRLPLQKAIDLPVNDIKFSKKYRIASYYDSEGKIGINIPTNKRIIGISNSGYDINHALIAAHGVEYNIFVRLNGRNITVQDLLIFCKENDISTSTNIGIGTPESFCPYITLDRVFVIDAIEVGFYLHTFICTMTRCLSSRAKIGYKIGGNATLGNGTTLTMNNCYAYQCPVNGYLINKMSYSSLISCAADGCGRNESNNDLDYVYSFEGCRAVNLVSCGQEGGGYSAKFIDCFMFVLSACIFSNNNNNENPNFETDNNIYIDSSYSIKLLNSILCSNVASDSEVVTATELCRSINIENCKYFDTDSRYRNVTYNSIKDGINGHCAVINEYVGSYNVTFSNLYQIATFDNFTLSNTVTAKLDSEGNKNMGSLNNVNGIVIFDGEGQDVTFWSGTSNIRNCKKVVFKNTNFVKSSSVDIAKLFIIENSEVEFENCSFDITDSASFLYTLDIINSNVVLNLCSFSAPNGKIANLVSSFLRRTSKSHGEISDYIYDSGNWVRISNLDSSIKEESYSLKSYIGANDSLTVDNLYDGFVIVENGSTSKQCLFFAVGGAPLVNITNNTVPNISIDNTQLNKLVISNTGSSSVTLKVKVIKYVSTL